MAKVLQDSSVFLHLLGNIFYLMEYREIFLTLLRKYDETRQPLSYLKDLVESTHLFLRMLERFCKGRKNLMVQVSPWIKYFVSIVTFNACLKCLYLALITLQKKKVRRKRSQGEKKPSVSEATPEALAETWKVVEEELKATGFQVSMRINLKGE